jgi:hypothetical protein
MQKIGQVISLGASKAKTVAGLVPDAITGLRLELNASRPGSKTVNLLDESIPQFKGGEAVVLAGRKLFDVPKAGTLVRQEALDWYTATFNQMLKQVDPKLPEIKQLELLDKAGEALRKAAETSLIDGDTVAEFAERVFRPSLAQLTTKLKAELNKTGEALQVKLLEAMRKPAIGCFVAGTLVHTKDGLKPIEQIKVGDWVLSRPENPDDGTSTDYKRVSKTFRFEDKEVVRFWWERSGNVTANMENWDTVYATPNHPVWLNPNGWVAMGRLHLPENRRPNTIPRGDGDWLNRELVLADGSTGAMLDVMDLYRTDQPQIAFMEDDDLDWGVLVDFAGGSAKFATYEMPYDYDSWGETPIRYTTTVYNLEVEDWHTYFVGKTGLWVHNTNCFDPKLEVAPGMGVVSELTNGLLPYSNYTTLTRKELNHTLRQNPEVTSGVTITRIDSADKHKDLEFGSGLLPSDVRYEDGGLGKLKDAAGLRYEYDVLINPASWSSLGSTSNLAERLQNARYIRIDNCYITESGTRVLVDRKLNSTSMATASLIFKPLDALFRMALAAESNPAFRFAIEMPAGNLTNYRTLLDNIQFNGINPSNTLLNGPQVSSAGIVRYTAAEMQFVLDKIRTHLLKVDANGNALKAGNGTLKPVLELLAEGSITPRLPFPQNVQAEGPALSTIDLDLAHVYLQLNQARQYWLNHGASLNQLNSARFAIADLPTGWAARTEGTQVTLDASGAGWGWYVDPAPQDNSEFAPAWADAAQQAVNGDYTAAPNSPAAGKLDLLTVLIHELGHVLGMPMPQSADGNAASAGHVMSQYLAPGQRRLPDAVDLAALQALGRDAYIGPSIGFTPGQQPASGTPVLPAPGHGAPTLSAWAAQGQTALTQGLQADRWASAGSVERHAFADARRSNSPEK